MVAIAITLTLNHNPNPNLSLDPNPNLNPNHSNHLRLRPFAIAAFCDSGLLRWRPFATGWLTWLVTTLPSTRLAQPIVVISKPKLDYFAELLQ